MANSPQPLEIKAARVGLGLSLAEFSSAIGYSDGEPGRRIVRALEAGERNGEPFTMAGPASAALHYLRCIVEAVRRFDGGAPGSDCIERLRMVLPEELR